MLPRTGRDLAAVLAVLALSTAVAVLALVTARGVTPLGGGSYDTEFLTAWCLLSWLLAPVPAAAARRRPATALARTVALVLPQFVAVTVCVARYRSSGWSDGVRRRRPLGWLAAWRSGGSRRTSAGWTRCGWWRPPSPSRARVR